MIKRCPEQQKDLVLVTAGPNTLVIVKANYQFSKLAEVDTQGTATPNRALVEKPADTQCFRPNDTFAVIGKR